MIFKKVTVAFFLIAVIVFAISGLILRFSEERLIPDYAQSVIREGYGIDACHIGMAQTELQSGWVKSPKFPWINNSVQESYLDPRSGIRAGIKGSRISWIRFIYEINISGGQMKGPFLGTTSRGISADSTVESVLHRYGEPTSIASTFRSFGDRIEEVDLSYMKDGITFVFADGRLQYILITDPSQPYDPMLDEDIGDTSKYRAMFKNRDGS